jgi:hypothetical protein
MLFGSSTTTRTALSDQVGGECALQDTPVLRAGRFSIRRSFMVKVLSPVIGYGDDFSLMHFIYDLVMWTTLGGCRNATRGKIPMRLAMKNASFTPAYWHIRHNGLIDMQRQCGYPALFQTRAPYERHWPYHVALMDEQVPCSIMPCSCKGLPTPACAYAHGIPKNKH